MPDSPFDSPRRGARSILIVAALASALFAGTLAVRARAEASRSELDEHAAATLAEIEALEAEGHGAEADAIAVAAWELVADGVSAGGATEELAFRALAARLQTRPTGADLEALGDDVSGFAEGADDSLRASLLEIGLAEARAGVPLPMDHGSWAGIHALTREQTDRLLLAGPVPPDLDDSLGGLVLRDEHVLRGPIDALLAGSGSNGLRRGITRFTMHGTRLPPRWILDDQEQLAASLFHANVRRARATEIIHRAARGRAGHFAPALGAGFGEWCERLLELAHDESLTDDEFAGVVQSLGFVTQAPLVMVDHPANGRPEDARFDRGPTLDWLETVRATADLPRGERTMARALGALDAIIAAEEQGLSVREYGVEGWLRARLSAPSIFTKPDLALLRSRIAARSTIEHLSTGVRDEVPDVLELTVGELVQRASALPDSNHFVREKLYEIACTRAAESGQPYAFAPLTPTGRYGPARREMPDRWAALMAGQPVRTGRVDVAVLRWSPGDSAPEIPFQATLEPTVSRSDSIASTVESRAVPASSELPWLLAPRREWGPRDAQFEVDAFVADAGGGIDIRARYGSPRREMRETEAFRGLLWGWSVFQLEPGTAGVLGYGRVDGAAGKRDLYALIARPRAAGQSAPATPADWARALTARLVDMAEEVDAKEDSWSPSTPGERLGLNDAPALLIADHLARTLADPPDLLEPLLQREPLRTALKEKAALFNDHAANPRAVAVQRSEAGARVGAALAVLIAVLATRRWRLLVSLAAVAALAAPWAIHGSAADLADTRWVALSALLGAMLARHARNAGVAPIGAALIASALALEATAAHGVAADPMRAGAALLFVGGAVAHAWQGELHARRGGSLRGSAACWILGVLALPAAAAHVLVAAGGDPQSVSRFVPGLTLGARPALFVVAVLCVAFGGWLLENLPAREREAVAEPTPTNA